jgi:hypothetical protein
LFCSGDGRASAQSSALFIASPYSSAVSTRRSYMSLFGTWAHAGTAAEWMLGEREMTDDRPEMPESFTGRCMCRAVRYRISAAPIAAGLCHCDRCRPQSGSAHQNGEAKLPIVPEEFRSQRKGSRAGNAGLDTSTQGGRRWRRGDRDRSSGSAAGQVCSTWQMSKVFVSQHVAWIALYGSR